MVFISNPGSANDEDFTSRCAPKKKSRNVLLKVVMLDESIVPYEVNNRALGSELFDKVCDSFNLLERDYFGIEFSTSEGPAAWLDHEKPIMNQIESYETLLRFCVKFYPPDPNELEEEYLFCLQLKQDLADGSLTCSDETAALLASYIVQADCEDYSPENGLKSDYLSEIKFVPHQTKEIEEMIIENHKCHAGLTPAQSDMKFLNIARKLETYGIKPVFVKDVEGIPLQLAVTHMGIQVFQGSIKDYDTLEFTFSSRNQAKKFWKISIENYTFFRSVRNLRDSPRAKHKIIPTGSAFRYSGKTQKEVINYVRENSDFRMPFSRSFSSHLSTKDMYSPMQRRKSLENFHSAHLSKGSSVSGSHYFNHSEENVLPSTQSLTESKEDLMNPPRKISILKELEDRLERKSLGVYDDSFTNSLIKNSMEEEAINRSYLRALFTNSIQKSEAEAYRNSSRNYSTSNVPSPSTPYKNVRIKSLPTSNTFQKSHAIRHSLAVTDSPLLASSKKVSLSSPPGILKKNPQIKNSSSGGVHMVDSNESYHDNYGQSFSTRMENGGVEDTSKHCDAKADLCSQDDDDIDSFSPKFDFQELEKINGSDNDVFIPNKSEAAIITRDNNNSSSAYDLLDEDYLEVLDINAERLENCANTSTPPKPSFIAFKATPTSFSLGVNQCRMPPFASPRQKSLLTDQRIEIKTSNVMVVKVIERSSSEQSLNCEDIVVSSIGVDAPHIARESAKQLGAFPFLLVNPSTNLTMSHVDCIDVPDTSSSLNNAIVVTDPIKRNLKSSFQNSLTSQSSTQISTFTHINSFMLSSTLPKYTFSEMKEKPSILPKPKHLKSIMKKAERPCEAKSESDDEKVSESISTPFPKTCAHNAFSKDYDVANEIPYVLHVRYIPNTQTISKAAIALANTLAISSTPSLNHKAYFISNSQLSNKILLDKSAQEKFLNCNLIKVEDLPSLLSCSSVDDSIVPSSKSLLSSKNGHKQQQQPHTLKKASPFFKSYSSGSLRTMASHLSFIDDEVDANNYFDNAFFRYNSLYDNDDIGIQVKACVKKAAEQNNNETTTEADGYSDITIC